MKKFNLHTAADLITVIGGLSALLYEVPQLVRELIVWGKEIKAARKEKKLKKQQLEQNKN